MKEYGPKVFNPQEKLTPQGQKPYAESGGKYMPEGNSGGPERPQNNPPQERVIVPEQMPTGGNEQWYKVFQEGTGGEPLTPDFKRAIDSMVESGELPPIKTKNSREDSTPHSPTPSHNEDRQDIGTGPNESKSQFKSQEIGVNEPVSSDTFIDAEKGGELLVDVKPLETVENWEKTYTAPTDLSRNDEYTGRGETVRRPAGNMRRFGMEALPISGGDHAERERIEQAAEWERDHWYVKKMKDGKVLLDTQGNPIPERQRDKEGNEIPDTIIPYPARWTRNRAFLSEEVKRGLQDSELYGLTINNVEALAVEIMDTDKTPEYQVGGEFELLNEKGEFQANNFLHWTRQWMMYWHNEDPMGKRDFGREVGLKRDYNSIPLQELVNRAGRYFRSGRLDKEDENGNGMVYTELVEQIKRELWLFGSSREFNITYTESMGRDEDLAKALNQMFFTNTFTKSVWGNRSALYWMANMPQHFQEVDSNAGEKQDDGRIGEALTTAYLIYYNMSDEDELRRILGDNTDLLNPDRLDEALKRQMHEEHIPEELRKDYISESDMNLLKPGKVVNFINIFNQPGKDPRIVKLVRTMIQSELAKKYDLHLKDKKGNTVQTDRDKLDKDGRPIPDGKGGYEQEKVDKIDTVSTDYADTFAWSMSRWTGAGARNDTNFVGYDAWTKFIHLDGYRGKQIDPKRIGAYGNEYTIHHLKQLALDFFSGSQALNGMSPLEIFTQLHNNRTIKGDTDLSSLSEKEQYLEYEKKSSQLVFADNVMRAFTVDHYNRVFAIYSQIMDSEVIDFDKFTKFDLINGLKFNRGQFEKALKDGFFKPRRYAWSTYRGINLAKQTRTFNVETGQYETVRVAEAMFGRQILDIPPLWKKGNEHIKMTDSNWDEKIDWDKLEENPVVYTYVNDKGDTVKVELGEVLWRREAFFELAAQYWSNKDRHSREEGYDDRYYAQIMMAIELLPRYIAGDETNMRASRAWGSALTEEEKHWIRSLSHTESWRLFMSGYGKQLASEGVKGLGNAVTAFAKGVTS